MDLIKMCCVNEMLVNLWDTADYTHSSLHVWPVITVINKPEALIMSSLWLD